MNKTAMQDILFEKIFQHSNDAIFIVNPNEDKIINANPKACEMLGYDHSQLIQMPMSAIHPDEMLQMQEFAEHVFTNGQGWTNELTCMTVKGIKLPSEMSASVIEVDNTPLMVAMVRDIKDRKEAEDALKSRNRQFKRVHHLALSTVENMVDIIQRGGDSHEILTYLNDMKSQLDSIQ
jgi:PAS domain S-box-containing protein